MKLLKFILLFNLLISFSANALLEVNIIKSKEAAFPMVIAPFEFTGDSKQTIDISKIIRDNLNRSGQFNALSTDQLVGNQIDFNFWQEHKKDAVVFGKIEQYQYLQRYPLFAETPICRDTHHKNCKLIIVGVCVIFFELNTVVISDFCCPS